jgi:hypothetical protein
MLYILPRQFDDVKLALHRLEFQGKANNGPQNTIVQAAALLVVLRATGGGSRSCR